jgi:hypothetical protein
MRVGGGGGSDEELGDVWALFEFDTPIFSPVGSQVCCRAVSCRAVPPCSFVGRG